MSHNLQVALALATQGIAVFPAQNAPGTDRHKKPCNGVWWRSKSSTTASTIEAWWRLWPDAMPAIDCGKSGLLVIDLDRKAGAPNGVAAWAELATGCESDCPVSETPSGGRHLIFRQLSPPHGNGRGGLPKGIDVRGAGGYIVAPGASCLDGSEYRLSGSLVDAPPLPDWLADIIRRGKPKTDSLPATAVSPQPRPQPTDPDRIREALRHIPADDRAVWLNVGMAIKSEQGATGWGLWRDWSMTSDKWDEADGRKVWRSIKPEGGITIATLYSLAQDHGWRETPARDPAQEAKGAELARNLMRTKEGDLVDAETGEIMDAQPTQLQDRGERASKLTTPAPLLKSLGPIWGVMPAACISRAACSMGCALPVPVGARASAYRCVALCVGPALSRPIAVPTTTTDASRAMAGDG